MVHSMLADQQDNVADVVVGVDEPLTLHGHNDTDCVHLAKSEHW